MTASFSNLPLRAELQASIAGLSYASMTAIQEQALPPLLQGQDLIAQARTGSGKTAAFAIGLLNKLDAQAYHTQTLVLCPTRELADQVATEIRRLASHIANTKVLTLCGGKPMGPQLASLRRAPHIVVGTPGRILKHLEKQTLQLEAVQTLVLDEADRMLDMGFHDDIMKIIANTPPTRQTLLFSATYPEGIQTISTSVQRNPVDVRVEPKLDSPDIEQIFIKVDKKQRTALSERDLHARALHGDLEQFDRDQVLAQFAGKSLSILIATDVAARGLDVKELEAVINYEISRDPEVHIHRIGRTARAGEKGLAVSLFTDHDARQLSAIEDYQCVPVNQLDAENLSVPPNFKLYPPMVTLMVNGGRKDKVRAGDLLGALTASKDIAGDQVGKITLFDKVAYVAVEQKIGKLAHSVLSEGKIKGRMFRVRLLR
ncbi:dbpA [Symbiodinium microadriaticum]|nr:dbpA [Symbiodinium microadriaticum]